MLRGHGGEIYHLARELEIHPSEIRDHSSNVSPLPPPEGLYSFLGEHLREIENLPEVDSFSLRIALAEKYALNPSQIFPSSGTTEWIFAIPQILKPQRILILGPTYSDYADAARLSGIESIFFLAQEVENFSPPLNELLCSLKEKDLVFICNPNNPTGTFISVSKLYEIISNFSQVLFVVDESYSDFVRGESSLLNFERVPENLIILRSFSKIYRIPGLRLGYAIAGLKLSKKLWEVLLPWSVNRLAQIVGPWLLRREDYIVQVQNYIEEERKRFLKELEKLPLKVFPSKTHFFLVKLKCEAQKIWEFLLKKHHILVRDASNFYGLDHYYLRFALRGKEENDILLTALKEVLL